jgi:hypothetical protein
LFSQLFIGFLFGFIHNTDFSIFYIVEKLLLYSFVLNPRQLQGQFFDHVQDDFFFLRLQFV